MKKYIRLVCFALMTAVFLDGRCFAAEVIERIVAVVNDEIITDQDLNLVVAPVAAQYHTIYTGGELKARLGRARQDFLNKLIEDKLILSEAKRKKVIVQDSEVDEMLTEVRTKFPSREAFLKALEDQGMTEKKLWNRFRDQVMTQKYVNFEVRSRISVSPGEISDYYKAHETDFTRQDRVKIQQILVREGSRSEEEAKSFAESLLEQIKSGKDFSELAKAYSEGSEAKDGGDMGWVERGQLLGEIDEKIFSIAPGNVTGAIKSALGYHIFKALEKENSSTRPLVEVKNEIQDTIYKEKIRKKMEAWIANLRKDAYISIRA